MGVIIPPTSPWTFYSATDALGKTISATVSFSGAWTGTNTLTSGNVHRDAGCQWTRVIIGALNPDGSPATGSKTITIPTGDTPITQGQLNANGLTTVADVLTAPQITAIH